MQRNQQQEKFIQGIKTIRDYWLVFYRIRQQRNR